MRVTGESRKGSLGVVGFPTSTDPINGVVVAAVVAVVVVAVVVAVAVAEEVDEPRRAGLFLVLLLSLLRGMSTREEGEEKGGRPGFTRAAVGEEM